MICGLEGTRGVIKPKKRLQLEQSGAWAKNSHIKLVHKRLSTEDTHPLLSSSYDDIMTQMQTTAQTRLQSRNEPSSILTVTVSITAF